MENLLRALDQVIAKLENDLEMEKLLKEIEHKKVEKLTADLEALKNKYEGERNANK